MVIPFLPLCSCFIFSIFSPQVWQYLVRMLCTLLFCRLKYWGTITYTEMRMACKRMQFFSRCICFSSHLLYAALHSCLLFSKSHNCWEKSTQGLFSQLERPYLAHTFPLRPTFFSEASPNSPESCSSLDTLHVHLFFLTSSIVSLNEIVSSSKTEVGVT